MNAISLDTLKLRVPPIEYVCPPVCEVTLSGSGFPTIDLEAFGNDLPPPGPIQPPDFPDDPYFKFPPTTPTPLCVNIAVRDQSGEFVIVEVCIPVRDCGNGLICVPPPGTGCFKFQIVTDIGTTPWSAESCLVAPEIETLPATDVT